ncbi:MAG: nuclear transport factor 2 family protein [Chloroflexi bacterium]|nr:nuclear transport factor 2 family protein [Chloroflexota bacterium]
MHRNEELVRAEAAAWETGDREAVVAFYTPEAVCDIRGFGPLAGEYRGHDGVREYYSKCVRLIEALDELGGELHDVVANDEHVVALRRVTARKGDLKAAWHIIEVYHVLDGRLDGVWAHSDPRDVVDDFFTQVARTLAEDA